MPALGILFDIEQLGDGLYGRAAYKILFEAVDTRLIPASVLSDGDTAATLAGQANLYCIAVESLDAARIELVRNAISRSSATGLLPAASRFIGEAQVSREPLVRAAHIDAFGRIVDCKTGWLVAAWEQTRDRHPAEVESIPLAPALAPATAGVEAPPIIPPPPAPSWDLPFTALFDRQRFGLNWSVGVANLAALMILEFSWMIPELLAGHRVGFNAAAYYAVQVVIAAAESLLLVLVLHWVRRSGRLALAWGVAYAVCETGSRLAWDALQSLHLPPAILYGPGPIAAKIIGGALLVVMLVLAVRIWKVSLRAFLAAGGAAFTLSAIVTLVVYQWTVPNFRPHWDNVLLALGNGLILGACLYAGVTRHLRRFGWRPGGDEFEVIRPDGDGLCSDNSCPCEDTVIPRGSGYLYISGDVVIHRRRAHTIAEGDALARRMASDLNQRSGGRAAYADFNNILVPVLMCERGARLRGLDLNVAAADARHWWATGRVPLRATPSARPAS